MPPGVRDTKPVQDARLTPFHAACLASSLMAIASQMQCPVHDEVRHDVGRTPARGGSFAPNHAGRNKDVAAVERQHIRRLVAAAVPRIQALDRLVGRKHHDPCSARRADCARGERLGIRHHPPPRSIRDDDWCFPWSL
jgi:hypothetical protein